MGTKFECEKCGLPFHKLQAVKVNMFFGKPIFKKYCGACRKKWEKENETEINTLGK